MFIINCISICNFISVETTTIAKSTENKKITQIVFNVEFAINRKVGNENKGRNYSGISS